MHIPANALNKRDLGLEAEVPFLQKAGNESGTSWILSDRLDN